MRMKSNPVLFTKVGEKESCGSKLVWNLSFIQ